MNLGKLIIGIVCAAFISSSARAASEHVDSFTQLVFSGDYKAADFYISNGYINAETIDSAQIFYDVLDLKYEWQIKSNVSNLAVLVKYLDDVDPIGLNRVFSCGYNRRDECTLANQLIKTEQPISIIQQFVDMGVDLNYSPPALPPLEPFLLAHLGRKYSVADLQKFSEMGFSFGGRTLELNALLPSENYQSSYFRLNLPVEEIRSTQINFLDLIVGVLGASNDWNRTNSYETSKHSEALCSFAIYAAETYVPSFDYLSFLLKERPEFRANNLNITATSGRRIFHPFPSSCANLMMSMAASHAQIGTVISGLAAQGDVKTAKWFSSISGQ